MTGAPEVHGPAVRVRQLSHGEGLPLPAYQTPGSAGLDLIAALPANGPIILEPGRTAAVPTGLVIELPAGLEAQVRPRSGLAAKHGVTVLNAPGTIDSDYRGEIKVLLVNLGREPFLIRRGERIAQMVVAPVVQISLVASGDLSATARGAGGFGSTGRATGPDKNSRPPKVNSAEKPTTDRAKRGAKPAKSQ